MKSSLALYISISLLISGMLAGCGQPGPLFMPKPPAKPAPEQAATSGKPAITPAPVPPPPAMPTPVQ
ncbi:MULTISPECIES: LPS translocon maturation chaperone LptM [unclassified Janthinobacterium]|uniref:LPS translocon maturation chaperone LptM n=1 Tax=unclassified Janthinobacterium TaxID=2610881 RepID=UPI000477DBB2|nr:MULTISPECIES: hypothetical protein [unclassified Janthinobacterium]